MTHTATASPAVPHSSGHSNLPLEGVSCRSVGLLGRASGDNHDLFLRERCYLRVAEIDERILITRPF